MRFALTMRARPKSPHPDNGQASTNRPSSYCCIGEGAGTQRAGSGPRSKTKDQLMKIAKDNSRKIEALTKVSAKNGKLDKATVDSALDRILAAMNSVNDELDTLLAKARK